MIPYQKLVRLRCPVLKFDADDAIIELHTYFFECPEYWCTINELGESWTVKIDESHKQVTELRGVDDFHETVPQNWHARLPNSQHVI